MKTTLLLSKARKTLQAAQAQTLTDEKAGRIAKETAQAAKIKLKYARKIARLARKAAKSARQKVAESLHVLNKARKKLRKLEKRAEHDRKKSKHSKKDRRAKTHQKKSGKRTSGSARPAFRARNRTQLKRRTTRVTAQKPSKPNKPLPLPVREQSDTSTAMEPERKLDTGETPPTEETSARGPSLGVPVP